MRALLVVLAFLPATASADDGSEARALLGSGVVEKYGDRHDDIDTVRADPLGGLC